MRKLTTEEFIERLHVINPSIKVIGKYINTRTKILVKCIKCSFEWEGNPSDLLSGHGCSRCRNINTGNRCRKSNNDFVNEMKLINPNIEIIEPYVTSQKPIAVKCRVCKNEWIVKPNTLLNGIGCAKCAGLKKKTTQEIKNELKIKNSTIEVLGDYNGNRSRILVRCKNCGYEWKPTAKSLLIGRGCPECVKNGTSFMEQFILSVFVCLLGKESVINRDRNALGVELDIYIPSKSFAIEPGSWFWHKENIEKDIEKRTKAIQSGIRIITIYDSFPLDEKIPFDTDCYVFEGQLNEPGYKRLKSLTFELIKLCGLDYELTEDFWDDVINEAHKGCSRISHDDFVESISSISPQIEILGKYKNLKEKIDVKCKECGYQWQTTPSLLLKGSGCVSCYGLKRKTTDEFVSEMKTISPHIEILGDYINTKTKIKVKSNICGHIW